MDTVPFQFNGDILRLVAFAASRKTCASLMRTCRFLYHEAAISALQQEVYLSCDAQIDKFLRFVEAEDRTRFRYVRSLRLHLHLLSPEQVNGIIDSMKWMTHLTSLELSDGEHALRTYPEMGVVLRQLPTLRHLGSCSVGKLFIALLSDLDCDLTSISLDWSTVVGKSFLHREVAREDWVKYHPVPFLSKWTHCLEELQCTGWYTPEFKDDPRFDAVYPRMRRLFIVRDDFPDPLPYIQAYPNLTHLSVQSSHVQAQVDLRQRRDENLKRQVRFSGSGSWQDLEEYRGNLDDLYLLGLTCRIERIVLYAQLNDCRPQLLSDVLLYAKPLHLRVTGDGALLVCPRNAIRSLSLPVILGEPGATRLESLVLKISLRRELDENLDMDSGLGALATALASLPLRRLRLLVDASKINPTPKGTVGQPAPPLPDPPFPYSNAERSLQAFDLDGCMQTLAETLPSLTDVLVRIHGPRGNMRQWEIKPKGGRELAPGLDWTDFEFY
ncbi:hypothetical protein L226DRAFT_175117 [Lentinus tigrinus ALCF2SS1-7]|uniref:uncharacterized protein n=1 Tax=Lentinus tigrinus ALCF2SS1-7 TaxID=1328758 RepID=UPI001166254B|nr:hypothetical protein L226DRAFT_175117 [Lentinus tigrinus ALCF2SS1-7]